MYRSELLTRRNFFQRVSTGLHGAALTYLLGREFSFSPVARVKDEANHEYEGQNESRSEKSHW